MDSSTQAITPLRQRMIDDMRMRKLADQTQSHYIRAVRQFAGFLGRSPDTASVEDLRRYQLHLVDRGTSPISLNAAITGLKVFFEVTLDHGELIAKMQPVRVPRTLPVVLSREEVASSKHPTSPRHRRACERCPRPVDSPDHRAQPDCQQSNPHTCVASPDRTGASRGFLP